MNVKSIIYLFLNPAVCYLLPKIARLIIKKMEIASNSWISLGIGGVYYYSIIILIIACILLEIFLAILLFKNNMNLGIIYKILIILISLGLLGTAAISNILYFMVFA